MIKKTIQKLVKKTGYSLVKNTGTSGLNFELDHSRKLGYDHEQEANESIKKIRAKTMLPYARLVTLYQAVLHCEKRGVGGDYVECGVWKGGAVGLMALANLAHGIRRRKIHLFDAFTDICQPNPEKDGERALQEAAAYGKTRKECLIGEIKPMDGFYDSFGGPGVKDEVAEFLKNQIGYPEEQTIFHHGWFQNTVHADSKEMSNIAILRLDGDWYESVKICLDHLYEKVVIGGFVIIDDYSTYEGCTRAVDEFRAANGIMDYLHHVDHGCRYWIKGESHR